MVKTTIVNVVATAVLNQKIDLYELGKIRGIIHDPEMYGGRVAYFKSSKMIGKVSVFASGKMISVGTKSEKEAVHELEIAKDFLVEKGFIKSTILRHKIHNMVVMIDFKQSISLEELATKYKMIYEPGQFPGCILKIEEPYKATVLIFNSGKIIVAGIASSVQIKPIVKKIENMIKSI